MKKHNSLRLAMALLFGLAGVAAASMASSSLPGAPAHTVLAAAEEQTVVGEVTDSMCASMKDKRGESHKQCAMLCIKQHGSDIVIAAEGDKLYTVDKSTSKELRDKLIQNVAKKVKVTGTVTVTTKDGENSIVVTKVEAQ